jgi:hypothetical protein
VSPGGQITKLKRIKEGEISTETGREKRTTARWLGFAFRVDPESMCNEPEREEIEGEHARKESKESGASSLVFQAVTSVLKYSE